MWEEAYWLLEEIKGEKLAANSEKRPLYFHLPEGPEGKVEGFAGCNQFFGTCKADQKSIQFDRMASTKMMCPQMETEKAFLAALERADSYKLEGKRLHLLGQEAVLATFLLAKEEKVKRK